MGAAKKITTEDVTSRLDELPTLPTIVHELNRTINDPMSSTAEVEKLMQKDQSLTMKVLKLVNSAYYAIPGGVNSLARAIAYLGYDTVNQLVLSSAIFDALATNEKPPHFDVKEFWKHSLGVAIAAETIGKFIRHPQTADLFTGGLIHDMGKIAFFTIAKEDFSNLIIYAQEKKLSLHEAEMELDMPRHTLVGHKLAQKWALPAQAQAIIKNHHQKETNMRGGISTDLQRSVDIVFLANIMVHAMNFGHSGHSKAIGIPVDVMERLAIHPQNDLKKLLSDIKSGLDKTSDFLRVLGAE